MSAILRIAVIWKYYTGRIQAAPKRKMHIDVRIQVHPVPAPAPSLLIRTSYNTLVRTLISKQMFLNISIMKLNNVYALI